MLSTAVSQPRIIVKSSTLHGMGVFSDSPIAAGTMALPWMNTKEISPNEYDALSSYERRYIDRQGEKIFLVGIPERYVNHSCDPNTRPGSLSDIAIREIAVGEEITSDYSSFFIPGGPFQCKCGSLRCRGLITGRDA